jgi:hypothetical protein
VAQAAAAAAAAAAEVGLQHGTASHVFARAETTLEHVQGGLCVHASCTRAHKQRQPSLAHHGCSHVVWVVCAGQHESQDVVACKLRGVRAVVAVKHLHSACINRAAGEIGQGRAKQQWGFVSSSACLHMDVMAGQSCSANTATSLDVQPTHACEAGSAAAACADKT